MPKSSKEIGFDLGLSEFLIENKNPKIKDLKIREWTCENCGEYDATRSV